MHNSLHTGSVCSNNNDNNNHMFGVSHIAKYTFEIIQNMNLLLAKIYVYFHLSIDGIRIILLKNHCAEDNNLGAKCQCRHVMVIY